MNYYAEIIRYGSGEKPNDQYEEAFETYEKASQWIKSQQRYGFCRQWINNKEVDSEGNIKPKPDLFQSVVDIVKAFDGMVSTGNGAAMPLRFDK